MTISRLHLFAGLALAASVAGPAHAQGLLGQPVDVTYVVAGYSAPPDAYVEDFGTQTIIPAGNAYIPSDNSIMAFITPTQIVYSLAPGHLGVGNSPTPFFVGYIATENGSNPAAITDVTLDPTTTATGFTSSSITFDATNVFANFSGTNFTQGQQLVLDVTSPAAVPEASTTVSFGLLLAFGLGGGLIAARKKKASA